MTEHETRNDGPGLDGATTRRRFVTAATAAGVGVGLSSVTAGSASAQDGGMPLPVLEREGNLMVDPQGEKVILRGVNVVDPKRANEKAPYYKRRIEEYIDMATDHENDWYARVIRLPLQPQDIYPDGNEGQEPDPGAFTQDDLDTYLENHVDPAVEKAREENVYIILDYHRHFPDGPLWTDDDLDEEVRSFWETVAARYASESHVLYEVYNEPHEPYAGANTGPSGGIDVLEPEAEDTWLQWREVAQPWVDVVRDNSQGQPILIGSPRWSQWTWWAKEHEFTGENLAYTAHTYTHEGLRPLSTYFGEPAEEVPVFMTEFGWGGSEEFSQGSREENGPEFANFYDEFPVHWQAWCFDFNWEPSMLSQADYTIKNDWGQWTQDYLYEWRNDDLPTTGSGCGTVPAPDDVQIVDTTETTAEVEWTSVSVADEYAFYVEGGEVLTTTATSATVSDLNPEMEFTFGVTTIADDCESVATTVTWGGEPTACGDADGGSLVVDGQTVCNVNGDAYFRDVNGDGNVGNRDVGGFFEQFHFDAYDRDEFDYSGNGRVSHGDVVALFDYVVG